MKKMKTVLSVAAVLLVFAVLLGLVQNLLRPKYMTDLVEGSILFRLIQRGRCISAVEYRSLAPRRHIHRQRG